MLNSSAKQQNKYINKKMNVEEFRKYGKEVIDYICEYGSNIEERDVAPTLNPGYLKKLLPGMQKISKYSTI